MCGKRGSLSFNFEKRNDNEFVGLKVPWILGTNNIFLMYSDNPFIYGKEMYQNNLVYKIDCLNCDGT